jgi:signal transduction histidine kinase/DNA-binding response OmpR family regulator
MWAKSSFFKKLTCFLCFFLASCYAFLPDYHLTAQSNLFQHRHLTTQDGLSNNQVLSLANDNRGFLWIGTKYGLNRFDGLNFTTYTRENAGLTSNLINDIVKAPDGALWLLRFQENYGKKEYFSIDIFDPLAENCQQLQEVFPDFPEEVVELKDIFAVPGGILITFKEDRYFLLDSEGKIKPLVFPKGIEILFGMEGKRYIATDQNSYFILNESGEKLKQLNVEPGNQIEKFISDKTGTAWCIESKKSGAKNHPKFEFLGKINADNQYSKTTAITGPYYETDFCLTRQGRAPTLIMPDKILQYEDGSGQTLQHSIDLNPVTLLMPITRIEDKNGILWVGDHNGLYALNITQSQFKNYLVDQDPPIAVRGISQVSNKLLVNSHQDAKVIQLADKSETSYLNLPEMGILKPFSIRKTEEGSIFMVSNQLLEIDTASIRPIRKTNIEKKRGDRIWSFTRDRENRFWLGRGLNDILIVDGLDFTKTNYFDQYNGFDNAKSTFKWHFLEDGDFIWLSAQNGLYLIHKEKGIVAGFGANEESPYYLPAIIFHYVYKDATGTYWLATGDGGLIKLQVDPNNPGKNSYKQYTKADNFPSLELYAIFEDHDGWFWISSANGLIRFQPAREEVQVYLEEQGIAGNEFNKLAYYQNKEGIIYFGGLNGLTEINPKLFLNASDNNFDLVLSKATILSGKKDTIKNVLPDWFHEKKITLSPGDIFLTLEFALQDYFYSNKSQYSYRIKDLNENWNSLQNNVLQLAGLPYGEHALEVRARGRLNQFSNQNLIVTINVERPVYLRTWFLLLLAGLAGMSVWQYNAWRIRTIKRREETLELIVQQRTRKIEEDKKLIESQAEQLKELDSMKTRFFQNVSHELRTPLTLILGPLDKVLARNKLGNQDFTLLKIMKDNVKHLHKRINELLDLSSLDAVSLELHKEPVSFYSFLKKTIAQFESSAKVKNIQMQFDYQLDQELILLLDREKLEKILFNLLSNAIKFTPEKGEVGIYCKREKGNLILEVSDTGIGISSEEQEKIFDRFYQASKKDYYEGTGIGLSLCKELVELMQGTISVESKESQGSTFSVTLPLIETMTAPLAEEALEEKAELEVKPKIQAGDPVLVVEDNTSMQNYLKLVLEDYHVKVASHGKEALQILENGFIPVAIISDIMMPVMDGVQLLEIIRKHDNYRNIPVIMLTALNSSTQKIDALRIGVDDYLTKPFDEEELKASLFAVIANCKNRMAEKPTADQPASPSISEGDLAWLEKVEKIIMDNVGNPMFGIEQLADQLDMSTRRVQQKIKSICGLTPKAYQREIQLEKARRLLETGSCKSVSDLSKMVGFSDAHYFSTLYEKRFGKKPVDYL